jgi:hypothetical protein
MNLEAMARYVEEALVRLAADDADGARGPLLVLQQMIAAALKVPRSQRITERLRPVQSERPHAALETLPDSE